MKSIRATLFLLTLLLAFSNLWSQEQGLTLEDIFQSSKYRLKTLSGIQWLPDGSGFLYLKKEKDEKALMLHRVKNGEEELWLDLTKLEDPFTKKPLKVFSYMISKDGKKILFKTDARRVWRRFDEARFFVYEIDSQKLIPVHADSVRVRHAKLSPNGKMVGYVLDNNIYVQDLASGKIAQITNDGSETIINGQFDWVYEEEFGQSDGWRWSPDSKKIAFWRVDQSPEPTFSWCEFEGKYGKVRTIHYPKAGDPNALVKIGVHHLQKGVTVWMDIGKEKDIYIPRIAWLPDSRRLSIQRMNRLQNKLELLVANANNGIARVVLTEQDSCWIDVRNDLRFLKKSSEFIWTSERDGFRHIYLYSTAGKMERQLTKGSFEVTSILGVDEKGRRIFFTANKGNVLENHIFSIKLNGRGLRQLDGEEGWHYASFAPNWKYFIDTFSSARQPVKQILKNAKGKILRTLIENSLDRFKEVQLAFPEFLTFTTEDGVTLNARIIKPVDFDPSKRYPVLIYGYGGPGSQLVRNSWGRSILWYTLLTQKGYIIFTVDNRGTGGRGKAFKNLAYGDIGKYALKDHIEAAKYLASLPYVDKDRIGIWGWSGGGYLTLMAMTKGSKYFKMGIAVAPVADFRLYDTIWTERYMGLPQNNAAGYDSTSVLSYVDQYRRGLLIVHGSSDDNVHMQNTMQVIKRFQQAGKQFELMIYPSLNHSLIGPNAHYHLYKMMTNFILRNL